MNTLSQRLFGAHQFAVLGKIPTTGKEALRQAVRLMAFAGVQIFELVGYPFNELSAEDTAEAILAGGISEISYNRTFPGGRPAPLGNPVGMSAESRERAQRTLSDDIEFIKKLRFAGITVRFLVGPNSFATDNDYSDAANLTEDRIVRHFEPFAEQLRAMKIQVAIKYRGPEHDIGAIGGIAKALRILEKFDPTVFGLHGDLHEMVECGEKPHETIIAAGKRLVYLNAQGTSGCVPGNFTPCDSDPIVDETNWLLLAKALTHVGYAGPIVPQPFGDDVPVRINPSAYYGVAHDQFFKTGILL